MAEVIVAPVLSDYHLVPNKCAGCAGRKQALRLVQFQSSLHHEDLSFMWWKYGEGRLNSSWVTASETQKSGGRHLFEQAFFWHYMALPETGGLIFFCVFFSMWVQRCPNRCPPPSIACSWNTRNGWNWWFLYKKCMGLWWTVLIYCKLFCSLMMDFRSNFEPIILYQSRGLLPPSGHLFEWIWYQI